MRKNKKIYMWIISAALLVYSGTVIYKYFPEITCKYFVNKSFEKAKLKVKKIQVGPDIYSYAEGGSGPTIVFVHGFQGDKRFWLSYVKKFIDRYHVVIPDLPAHGQTSFNENQKFDLLSLAHALDGFIKAKNLSDFTLIGTSLGGGITTRYTHTYPEKVNKLVLINPIGIKPENEKDYFEMVKTNQSLFFPNNIKQLDELYVYLMGAPLDIIKPFKRYILDYLIEKKAVFQKVYDDLINSAPVNDILKEIKTPTLLLFGKYDKVSRPVDFEIYSNRLPACHSVLITSGYHILKDKAFDLAVEEMNEFIISPDEKELGQVVIR